MMFSVRSFSFLRPRVITALGLLLHVLLLAAGSGLWLLPTQAAAQTGLTIDLVSESTAIVPGQTFRVGLSIRHEPGWHTYWRQPGIVGVPTSIAWDLPPGFKAGALLYPEPESVLMFRIKAQGFERDLLLQTEITAPADLPLGTPVTLAGNATWMCCGNTCHPGHKKLSLTLPVAKTKAPDAQWSPVFEKERAAFPRTSPAWQAQASEDGLKVTLTLTPQAGARPFSAGEKVIFFTDDGWINSDEPQTHEYTPGGGLTLHLTRADVFLGKVIPNQLFGVIQREGGWEKDHTWRSLEIAPELKRVQPAGK